MEEFCSLKIVETPITWRQTVYEDGYRWTRRAKDTRYKAIITCEDCSAYHQGNHAWTAVQPGKTPSLLDTLGYGPVSRIEAYHEELLLEIQRQRAGRMGMAEAAE